MQSLLPCFNIYRFYCRNGKKVGWEDEDEKQAFHCPAFEVCTDSFQPFFEYILSAYLLSFVMLDCQLTLSVYLILCRICIFFFYKNQSFHQKKQNTNTNTTTSSTLLPTMYNHPTVVTICKTRGVVQQTQKQNLYSLSSYEHDTQRINVNFSIFSEKSSLSIQSFGCVYAACLL